MFCHSCELLGHDLKHCAWYFALTKNGVNDACQYSDWLKANGSCACFPPQKDSARKDNPHEEGEGDEWPNQASSRVETTVDDDQDDVNPRVRTEKHMEGNYEISGITPEKVHVNSRSSRAEVIEMERVGWLTSVNEISNSNKVDTGLIDALNHMQNKTGDNRP